MRCSVCDSRTESMGYGDEKCSECGHIEYSESEKDFNYRIHKGYQKMISDKIAELAEQAGMSFDKYGMAFAKDRHEEDGVDLDKFALLLIAKCVELCNNVEADDELVGHSDGALLCAEEIKEYFDI